MNGAKIVQLIPTANALSINILQLPEVSFYLQWMSVLCCPSRGWERNWFLTNPNSSAQQIPPPNFLEFSYTKIPISPPPFESARCVLSPSSIGSAWPAAPPKAVVMVQPQAVWSLSQTWGHQRLELLYLLGQWESPSSAEAATWFWPPADEP